MLSHYRVAKHPDQKKRHGYYIIMSVSPDGSSEQWGHAIFQNAEIAEQQIRLIVRTTHIEGE